MFTHLRVQNFKAWKGSHQIELAPLSLFLGTNSAGKTSLLQVLLLLKQTAESPDRRQHLNLGQNNPGDVLDLGSPRDIISDHSVKRELAFGLRFADSRHQLSKRPSIEYAVSYFEPTDGGDPVVKSLTYFDGSWTFKAERQTMGGYLLTKTTEPIWVNPDGLRVAGQGEPGGRWATPQENAEWTLPHETIPASRSYEPERSVAFSAEAVAALGREGAKVQDIALQMGQALKEIVYLGPLREAPKRGYQWKQKSPSNIGTKGEYAIQAILSSANDRTRRSESGGRGWLVEQVCRWLQTMEVADNLSLEQHGSSVHYEVLVHQGRIRANLIDVGFGVSQVLPVVTLAYFVPEGSTVIVEQPEIHLHPLAQTALADLFVEVSRTRHVQFLVETHSEHLFRRLQTLIAEEKFSPDNCKLYFVKKERGVAELQRLDVDNFGRIENWPDKFFGDAIGEVERQTQQRIKGMTKRQRG